MEDIKFIETIRVINGELEYLSYHKKRIIETSQKFNFNFDFETLNSIIIPDNLKDKELKLRILYSKTSFEYDLSIYNRRKIKSLKIVECNDIDYGFKFENRDKINLLSKQKGNYDEILIIKNGFVTDTSFSNIVFVDENNNLFTPNTYLLNGTMRQRLINEKIISEKEITVNEINKYKGIILINAMNDMNDNTIIEEVS